MIIIMMIFLFVFLASVCNTAPPACHILQFYVFYVELFLASVSAFSLPLSQFKTGFVQFFDVHSSDDRAQEALEGFMKKAFTYAAVGVAVVGFASMMMKK